MHWFCARRNYADERGTGLQAIVSGADRSWSMRPTPTCEQSFQAAVPGGGRCALARMSSASHARSDAPPPTRRRCRRPAAAPVDSPCASGAARHVAPTPRSDTRNTARCRGRPENRPTRAIASRSSSIAPGMCGARIVREARSDVDDERSRLGVEPLAQFVDRDDRRRKEARHSPALQCLDDDVRGGERPNAPARRAQRDLPSTRAPTRSGARTAHPRSSPRRPKAPRWPSMRRRTRPTRIFSAPAIGGATVANPGTNFEMTTEKNPQRSKMPSVCRTHVSGDSEMRHRNRSTG